MLRLERLEATAQVAQLSEPVRPHELTRHGLDVPDGAEYYLEDITRIDALDGELYKLVGPMARLLLKQFKVDEEALAVAQAECPAFFGVLQDVAVDAGLSDLTPSGLALATVRGPGIDRVQWVRGALEGLSIRLALPCGRPPTVMQSYACVGRSTTHACRPCSTTFSRSWPLTT